jgi:hypothetical protein
MPKSCLEVITCAFACIDLMQMPPKFSLTCVSNCVAQGCADVQFFVDQVLDCAILALPACGGDPTCIQKACDTEIAACIGAKCN